MISSIKVYKNQNQKTVGSNCYNWILLGEFLEKETEIKLRTTESRRRRMSNDGGKWADIRQVEQLSPERGREGGVKV